MRQLRSFGRLLGALARVARSWIRLAARPSVAGRRVAVAIPGTILVWLASTERDFPAMLDAQNIARDDPMASGQALAELKHASRAFWVIGGERGDVLREKTGACLVSFDDGRQGWVQAEFTARTP